MSLRQPTFTALALLASMALAGCPASETAPPVQRGAALFQRCELSDDCAEGLACSVDFYVSTDDGICSRECESNDDCESADGIRGECVEMPSVTDLTSGQTQARAVHTCLMRCSESDVGHYQCVAGERRFCEGDVQGSCEVCGCPAATFCEAETGLCRQYARGGEACLEDGECRSAKCLEGACTSGAGDPCGGGCDGTCGGPPDALYCMPRCDAGRCPVPLPMWECLAVETDPEMKFCGRVCSQDSDCIGEGSVCEPFPELDGSSPREASGYCHQARQ